VAAGFGFMGMIALASITRPAINVYQMEAVVEGWCPAMSFLESVRGAAPLCLVAKRDHGARHTVRPGDGVNGATAAHPGCAGAAGHARGWDAVQAAERGGG
jgi:hypothetical protein